MAEKKEKEKEAEEPAAEGGDEAGDAAKAKKKKLILFGAIGLVVLLGVGGGLFFFLSGGDHEEAAAEGEHAPAAEEHGAAEEPKEGEKKEEGGEHKAAGKEGEHAKEGEGHGKPDDKAKPAAPAKATGDFGDTFPMKTFHLNLGNPLENRYVRIEVSLEYTGGEDQKNEIEQRMPQLRDAVVSIVSRKTREFLLSPDGKDQLRKEVYTRINRYMTKPIKSVFITDLLIE